MQPYKILITGGRDYKNSDLVFCVLSAFKFLFGTSVTIIHGAATGADTLAGYWGEKLGLKVQPHPAKWSIYGKTLAGKIRNQEMLDKEDPNLVICFPGGSGTLDMCKRATLKGKYIWHVNNI